MRFVLPPARQPRNTLARIVLSVIGLAILGFFVVFGVLAAAVLLAVGGVALLWRQWKLSRRPSMRHGRRHDAAQERSGADSEPDVLEGEFVVVDDKQPRH